MSVKLSGRQMVNMYTAISKMKDNNVSASGLVEIDIAMNKVMIEPTVVAMEKLQKPNRKLEDYVRKQNNLRTRHLTKADEKEQQTLRDPLKFITESEALEEEYKTAIEQSRKNGDEYDKLLDRVVEVNLIMVEKTAFKFDGPGAAEVMFGLAPMLK